MEAVQACRCSCGATTFNIKGAPLFRILCHCTVCQRFNRSAFGDVLVYGAGSVEVPESGAVSFDRYRRPPNIARGKCMACGDPAIELVDLPLAPKLVIVPASMHGAESELPPPVAHIFYDKRVSDVADKLPRYCGYVPSQLAFIKHLVKARLFSSER